MRLQRPTSFKVCVSKHGFLLCTHLLRDVVTGTLSYMCVSNCSHMFTCASYVHPHVINEYEDRRYKEYCVMGGGRGGGGVSDLKLQQPGTESAGSEMKEER